MVNFAEETTCGHCQHAVARHNFEHGCQVCTCAATLPIPANPNPAPRKVPDMTRSAASIQNELDIIEREEEMLFQRKLALQAEAERLTRRPHEPAPGSVVKFHVQYDQNGPVYEYAALRFGDRWFTTGKNSPEKGRSWQGLLDLIEKDYSFQHAAAKARITIYESGSVRTW